MDLFHADRNPDEECNCCKSKEIIKKTVEFKCLVFKTELVLANDGMESLPVLRRDVIVNRDVPVAQKECLCNMCDEG